MRMPLHSLLARSAVCLAMGMLWTAKDPVEKWKVNTSKTKITYEIKPGTVVGQSQSTANSISRPANVVTIPFELVLKHVFVRVTVNHSRPLSFMLDTGDKMAIIDLDLAKELGLKFKGPVKGSGAGATTVTGAFIQDAQFEFPGFDGFSQPVMLAFPLKSLAGRIGHDIDGVIGSDFIKEFVTEIDYHARVVRLYDKDTFQYTGPGQSIPVELNAQGHPIVEAEVAPIGAKALTGKFLLDLGSSASLALYSPFVAQNHLPGPNVRTIRAMGAAGVGGEMKARIGRVTGLKIGPFRLVAPVALFAEDKAGAFASADIQGNIGEQILSRFKIFLDYSRQRIILEPNKSFGEPFTPAFAGIVCEAQGIDFRIFRITDVLENSPASEAGLLKGDVITSVNGRSALEFTLSDLEDMFERPATYRLGIKRGDTVKHVTVKPRTMI